MEQVLDFLGGIVISLISGLGYGGVFIAMVLESACIPLPSEIILPFAGYMVFVGKFSYWKITLVATLANVTGGLLAYFLGKYGGRPFLLKYGRFFLISEEKLKITDKFFQKYGEITVFFGRMLPVIRTFISLPAGIGRMSALKMSVYTFLGSLPWCALLIWSGYELGENWNTLKTIFHRFHIIIGICGAVSVLFIAFLILVWKRK
jgi:membrane protein DedA with SNARE-associated domain